MGAFQYLIGYYVTDYEKHPKEARAHPLYPELIKDGNGGHRLAIHPKAKILHNNLFGVDLDPQAVEITMMNLYLKALEGERDLPQKQQLLPELKFHIRCGNSLIAPDIAQPPKESQVAPASRRWPPKQQSHLSPEELARLRPFDWYSKTDGFGDILKAGGFDAVIGNPPYVFGEFLSKEQKAYWTKNYETAKGQYDFYLGL